MMIMSNHLNILSFVGKKNDRQKIRSVCALYAAFAATSAKETIVTKKRRSFCLNPTLGLWLGSCQYGFYLLP